MRYRKIDPALWNDAKVRELSDDGKLAWVFLLTHPGMTALGAMRGTMVGLAAELGWRPARWAKATAKMIEFGMIEVNDQAAYVGVPRFLKYNEPEGPNSVKRAWMAALGLIPECPEKRELARRCLAYLEARSQKFRTEIGDAIFDAFHDAIGDGMSHGMSDGIEDAKSEPSPIQEQEQEQEQDSPSGTHRTSPDRVNGKAKTDDQQLVDEFSALPGVMPSRRNYGFIGKLRKKYGADAVRRVLREAGPKIGAAVDPLQYLAGCVQRNGRARNGHQPQADVDPVARWRGPAADTEEAR